MVSTDYATGAGAKRRAYDAAVYTTNQRAALLTEQLTAHSIYSERWQGAEGGSSPPTAPIPFIKAIFTHNFFLQTREGAGGTRQSAVVPHFPFSRFMS